MYEELNKYVRGEKKINIFSSYKIMSMVEHFMLDEIRNMGFSEPQYKLHCVVRDKKGYDTSVLGEGIVFSNGTISITLNRRLIDGLDVMATSKDVEEFDKEYKDSFIRIDLFLIMFHELEHIHQAKMYETNTVDNMNLYKDRILNMYFYSKSNDNDYYSDNYKVTSEETLANIRAIEKTVKYFTKNNIEFTKEELEILRLKMNKYKALLNNKQRKNPIDGKMYDLDYLYNMVLQDQTYKIGSLSEEGKKK